MKPLLNKNIEVGKRKVNTKKDLRNDWKRKERKKGKQSGREEPNRSGKCLGFNRPLI